MEREFLHQQIRRAIVENRTNKNPIEPIKATIELNGGRTHPRQAIKVYSDNGRVYFVDRHGNCEDVFYGEMETTFHEFLAMTSEERSSAIDKAYV